MADVAWGGHATATSQGVRGVWLAAALALLKRLTL